MKFTEQDIKFLENFTQILGDEGILFKSGKEQRVMTAAQTIIAGASFDMEFPSSFAIIDLKQFTSILTNMNDPDISFKEDHMVMTDSTNHSSIEYYYSDPSLVREARTLRQIDPSYVFEISKDNLSKLIKMARIMGAEFAQVFSEEGKLYFGTLPTANKTNLKFEIGECDTDFVFCLELEKLILIPDDYDIEICQFADRVFGIFKAKNRPIVYTIASNAEHTRL